jgi:long-chain acyl-CoA synthetase
VEKLREDLITIRPTVLLAVPRLYERIHKASIEAGRLRKSLIRLTGIIGWRRHEWISGRGPSPAAHERFLWPILERLVARRVLAAFGGRLRVAVSGGAALQIEVSHFLIGLGLPLVEGYGLTEAAPVVTATTLQDSLPGSVGRPLTGLELKVDASGELLVRSPAVMKGYWKDADATARTITLEGWLRTGDTGKIDGGRLFITGRIKDLIVLSTGEKVASAAVEVAIQRDPLFEQVCVIGDGRPSLTAIVVLNRENWTEFARALGLDPGDPNTPSARTALMSRITDLTRSLPPFSQIRSGHFNLHPWEIQSGVLTPTLKIKRRVIEERYSSEIEHMYA